MAEILAYRLRLVVYLIIYRVSAPSQVVIARFQPSTEGSTLFCLTELQLKTCVNYQGNGSTLPETNSSPMKIPMGILVNTIKKVDFLWRTVSFREGNNAICSVYPPPTLQLFHF